MIIDKYQVAFCCTKCALFGLKLKCANVAVICQRRRLSRSIMRGQFLMLEASSSSSPLQKAALGWGMCVIFNIVGGFCLQNIGRTLIDLE